MTGLEALKINLLTMKEDSYEASFVLGDEFFGGLDDAEIRHGRVNATVLIRKAGGEFAMTLRVEGDVTVQCDLCLDDMEQHVRGEGSFIVKLGLEHGEEDDVITVAEDEGILDIAWLLYETIALAVPIKHVHAPGKCNAAMTERLEELSATRSGDEAEDGAVDPRWDKLKQLKDKL